MDDSLERLDSVHLAQLLDLDRAGSHWSAADGRAALLQQWAVPLPDEVLGAAGLTMLRALTSPEVRVEVLEWIKQFGREARQQAANPLAGGPGTVIYYAAIAAGVLRGWRITALTAAQLHEGFAWAMAQEGAERLRDVFAAAIEKIATGDSGSSR